MPDIYQFTASAADAGQRLDRFLTANLPDVSRSRMAALIDEGHVRVNGSAAKRAHRVAAGERIEVALVPRPALAAFPEEIPLEILYEDDDLLVVNKPAGMTVHAGAGTSHGTLVNALLHYVGKLSTTGGPLRPGIVHRLDKDTSGVLLVARNDAAHHNLAAQFQQRTVEKTYIALLHGRVKRERGTIALPVARDLRRRTRMTARSRGGRAARTDWNVLARFDRFTLVAARIHTGRTHQIRVHFSTLGHPVVGDALYGAPRQVRVPRGAATPAPLGRNFLHAARISFDHPRSGARLTFAAPLPPELLRFLRELAQACGVREEELTRLVDAVPGTL
ncbi:MAG TPA: RluA family pseudouridine synthase [Candidatus Acidoferrales bacterium]|nr:RluA family pseudouridine synthase [Candidatus Acidoferrales bacterium]